MKKVISASRRTDLVAFFPDWLSEAFREEKALVYGPSGRTYTADLSPEAVHTVVLWSKNFANLIENRNNLREAFQRHEQLYMHFTITGLGGSFIERGTPAPSEALCQLDPLAEIAGSPLRLSLRFDPVVYWQEDGKLTVRTLAARSVNTNSIILPCIDQKKLSRSFALPGDIQCTVIK